MKLFEEFTNLSKTGLELVHANMTILVLGNEPPILIFWFEKASIQP